MYCNCEVQQKGNLSNLQLWWSGFPSRDWSRYRWANNDRAVFPRDICDIFIQFNDDVRRRKTTASVIIDFARSKQRRILWFCFHCTVHHPLLDIRTRNSSVIWWFGPIPLRHHNITISCLMSKYGNSTCFLLSSLSLPVIDVIPLRAARHWHFPTLDGKIPPLPFPLSQSALRPNGSPNRVCYTPVCQLSSGRHWTVVFSHQNYYHGIFDVL